MRSYQVTRKLQVTIPKALAKEMRIRPGDTVIFEKAGNAVLVKKPGRHVRDHAELEKAVKLFAKDMVRVRKYVTTAERAITANLSRRIGS
jgi:AbrB family looped-hinge helix DNA binding protein